MPEQGQLSDLATVAINAHGGLDRWRRFKTVSAHLVQGRCGRNAGCALCVCPHGGLRNRRPDKAQDISTSAGREFSVRAARGVDRHQRHRIQLGP